MTRINTTMATGPFTHDMLLDQHLFVAYREVTRISTLSREAPDAPDNYVLGTGHMKFFFDKGLFLANQCEELYQACRARGYNCEHKIYCEHIPALNKDWEPDLNAHLQNLTRLHEKLQDKPKFYTLRGKPVKPDYYMNILQSVVEYYNAN